VFVWPVDAGARRDEEVAPSDVTEKPAPDNNQSRVSAPLISDTGDIQGQHIVELVINNQLHIFQSKQFLVELPTSSWTYRQLKSLHAKVMDLCQ